MRKPSEIELYRRLREMTGGKDWGQPGRLNIERIGADLGLHEKQTERFLEKWSNQNWWDWGVHVWGGWFTPNAPSHLSP